MADDRSSPLNHPRSKIATDAAVIRNCLRCNKPFFSYSPGNRICPDCNKTNKKVSERGVKKGRHKPRKSEND